MKLSPRAFDYMLATYMMAALIGASLLCYWQGWGRLATITGLAVWVPVFVIGAKYHWRNL